MVGFVPHVTIATHGDRPLMLHDSDGEEPITLGNATGVDLQQLRLLALNHSEDDHKTLAVVRVGLQGTQSVLHLYAIDNDAQDIVTCTSHVMQLPEHAPLGAAPGIIHTVDYEGGIHLAAFPGGGYIIFRIHSTLHTSVLHSSQGTITQVMEGHHPDHLVTISQLPQDEHFPLALHQLHCVVGGGLECLGVTNVIAAAPYGDGYCVIQQHGSGYRVIVIPRHGARTLSDLRAVMDIEGKESSEAPTLQFHAKGIVISYPASGIHALFSGFSTATRRACLSPVPSEATDE